MSSNFSEGESHNLIHPLGSKARSGVRGTVVGQSIRFIFALVALPIIARQLKPSDYGAFALLMLLIMFLDRLRDFGIISAVMGSKQFNEKTRSNVFWISAIGGCVVSAVGFLISEKILSFFNLQGYELQLKCLLLVLLFNGVSSIYLLNLRRILNFRSVVIIEIVSSSTSAVFGILAALNGLGIWALLIQTLSLSFITLIMSILYSDWKPRSPSKNSEVKDLYANGSYFFVVSYLEVLPQQFPSLILGRSGDTFEVGNFDRGRNIQNLFQNWFNIPIRQIGIPLVRARYHSEGFLEDSIQKVHRLTLHILLPIYVLIFCQAELFVQILYGNNYTAVVPILRILMIAAMIQTCDYIRLWVTVILNQGKNSLKPAIVSFLIYASCIFPMASSGVLQITGGYLLACFLTMLVGFWFLRKLEEVDVLNLLLISLRFLLIYAPLCVVLWFLHQRFVIELPNLVVFCFELSLIIATSLIHLKYSEFLSEFIHILKKLI